MSTATPTSKPIKIKEWSPNKKLKSSNGFYGLQTHFRIKKQQPSGAAASHQATSNKRMTPSGAPPAPPVPPQVQVFPVQGAYHPQQGIPHPTQQFPQHAMMQVPQMGAVATNTMMPNPHHEMHYGVQGGPYCHPPQGMPYTLHNDGSAYLLPDNFLDEVPLPGFCLSAFEKSMMSKLTEGDKTQILDEGMVHFVDGGQGVNCIAGKMISDHDLSYHLPPATVNYLNFEY